MCFSNQPLVVLLKFQNHVWINARRSSGSDSDGGWLAIVAISRRAIDSPVMVDGSRFLAESARPWSFFVQSVH